jgi:hypothetical protein
MYNHFVIKTTTFFINNLMHYGKDNKIYFLAVNYISLFFKG